MKDSPLMLEGVPYYTVTQFARLVGKDASRISYLVNHPEHKKHIQCMRKAGRPLIPYREVARFVQREAGITTGDADAVLN